ncbi:hypothetical protein AGDE_13064 [Angomonas deanei]|uniref:Uncharacterized protein n=1 Tax=Angomonas deanei TaxID=59799 RepID=A0A7G2CA25_9TRYP|nr:hypothetical protein AGDE_13064 [Angomonas deanei]CAD2215717.1 hypothetical protein, conserved [Angomonas deanei]|eukprot:EPY23083.1 hypothetical protein AGDE_13064 [Angomonas deanei]
MEGLNPHSDDDSDKEEKTNKQDGHKQKQAKRERTTEEADSTDATPQKKKVKFDRFEDCEVRWENLNLANKQKSVDSSVKIFLNHVINDAWIQQHYRDTSATVKPPKRKGGGSLITSVEDYTRATTVYHLLLTRVYQPIRELLLDYIALKRRSRSWLQQRLFPMYLLPPQTSDVAHSAQDDVDKSDFTARVVEEVTAFFAQQVPLEENVCKLYFQYKKLLLQLQRDIEDYLNLKKLRVL